jgi:hypothetical protein
VLWPVGKTREDQCCWTGVMSKFTKRCFHVRQLTT